MRYKGFSVGGKHAKVYFGRGKSGCGTRLFTLLGGLVLAALIYGAVTDHESGLGAFLFYGFFIVIGIVITILIIKAIRKHKGEAPAPDTVLDEASAEPSQWYFVLTGNEDADTQSALRDLRIRIELSTVPGKAQIRDEDGDITIVFNGLTLGRPEPEDAAWISEHFDSIIGIRWFYIRGGTLTADGEYCPFKVKVVASLKPGCTPPPEGDFWIPPLLHDRYDIKGDAVVLASKTGKIHKPTGCGANRSSCTPMLYGEAVDNGFTECGSCFR